MTKHSHYSDRDLKEAINNGFTFIDIICGYPFVSQEIIKREHQRKNERRIANNYFMNPRRKTK